MHITNLNPREDIGASCWHVELDGRSLLMDSGTHPKIIGKESLPLFHLLNGKRVDHIAVTHCHLDHVGSLPVALQHFPEAQVTMSEMSYFIIERVLHNSVNVMKRQRDEFDVKEYPLFSHREIDDIACQFEGCRHNQKIAWDQAGGDQSDPASPTLEFYDAGHALGSVGIMVRGERESLFYTGDVCFQDQTILRGARFEDVTADTLILETTRGDRDVPPGFTRQQEVQRFAEAAVEALSQKSSILIPVFALGRTQEILAMLALMMRDRRLKRQPVYIGGLGRVFTEIYDITAKRISRNLSDLNLHDSLHLIVMDRQQQDGMSLRSGRIFALTSGMMVENTPAHELAARMIEDERQRVFFVGYSDPNTPAGRLRQAAPNEKFFFSNTVGKLTRRCQVQEFDFSAHANREELVDFVGRVSPRTVILAHGEANSRNWFGKQIAKRYPQIRIVQPGPGESVTT